MGRKSSLAWHFRPEKADRITRKHGAIAKEAGIAPSHLSAVLKGRRPANERLVAAILDACPGAKRKDLFQERVGDEVPGKRTTDWRDEAETLRRELRLYDRSDVDLDFVGTDGSFLRAVLAATEDDTRVDGPCAYRVGRLRAAFIAPALLSVLRKYGLLTEASWRIAEDYRKCFRSRRRLTRADGGAMKIEALWRDGIPHCCATRVGDVVVCGDLGIDRSSGRFTVPIVRTLRRGVHADFTTVTEWIEEVFRDERKRSANGSGF